MGSDRIPKAEADLLSVAISKIVSTEVLERELSERLPLPTDLQDSNKIYYGKVSMLFVDMRGSTKLPDKYCKDELVKIYRSYIRAVVQAIRYSGGTVRDFMGDGVLAVFVDDEEGKSEDKAVYAARYIATAIDKFLNPVLDQIVKHRISCGIGIHTGDVSLSKVGMKGKEQDDEAENEFGIVWIGKSTNLACKFSGAVDCSTIFISPSTYVALSDTEGKQIWKKAEISKGNNLLSGYVAKGFYLQTDEEIVAYPAESCVERLSLLEELKGEYRKQLADIARRTEALGQKEQELEMREEEQDARAAELDHIENANQVTEKRLLKLEYSICYDVLRSGHCKAEYVKTMGKDFWEEWLEKTIKAGAKIGISANVVKQQISYAMVSIYQDLKIFDKAYDFLIEQATGCSWLHLFTVKSIVNEVRYCDRLKSALYARLAKHDLSPDNEIEFEKIKNWLVFEYKG